MGFQIAGEPSADQVLDDDSRSVWEALDAAYAALSPAAAYLFVRLCLGDSSLVSVGHPTTSAQPLMRRVRRMLDELAAAHLITDLGDARYRIHDVVRRFARRRGADPVDRDAVDEWLRGTDLTDHEADSQRI